MNYPPLTGIRLVLVTLSLSLAVFMEVLDTTIANVAVPVIAGDLGAATTQGTWVITSFAVANAISVPLTGFLAKRVGEVRLFVGSVIGFVITSWLCGISPNLQTLVFFRILQGFCRRTADSFVPKPPDGILPAGEADFGIGTLGDDSRGRPCFRADFRWLDFGQLALGVDIFHQYPHRYFVCGNCLAATARP